MSDGYGGYGPHEVPYCYLNRFSPTLVVLAKVFEGVISGYYAYTFGQLFLQVWKAGQSDRQAASMIRSILKLFTGDFSSEYTDYLLNNFILPAAVFILVFLAVLISMALNVVETVILVVVRISGKGAGAILGFHVVQMIFTTFYMLLYTYGIIDIYRRVRSLRFWEKGAGKAEYQLTMFVVFLVLFLFILMVICYHKDIIKAMRTVSFETHTGRRGYFSPTHLSGISFVFGTPYLIALVIVLYRLTQGNYHFSDDVSYTVVGILIYAAGMLKFYGISGAYGYMKKMH